MSKLNAKDRFKRIAKKCSRLSRQGKMKYKVCMSKELKKK